MHEELGGIETPGALEVTRFPSVIVPVCVVKGMSGTPCVEATPCMSEGVFVAEAPCMSETPRVSAPACVSGMVCVSETARVSERPCVRETACVRSLYVREMTVGMREHAAASPGVNVMSCSMSLVTRGSLSVRMRRGRQRQVDKGRVAAVVLMGTVPGWHSSERAVRAVQRTRPPRARLRE